LLEVGYDEDQENDEIASESDSNKHRKSKVVVQNNIVEENKLSKDC